MGILLGLMSAIFWGSADFLARDASRRIGSFRTLLFAQSVGFVVLGIYLPASGELSRLAAQTTPLDWAWAVLVAILNMISSLAIYHSFQVCVSMSIVSPIVASYAAITVALAFLSGEAVTATRGVGILLALAGVVLAASNFEPAHGRSAAQRGGPLGDGIGWAIFAALGYGVTFWLLGFRVTAVLGGVAPVWVVRAMTILCLTPILLLRGQPLRGTDRRVWRTILAIGTLDTAAFVANAIGLTTDQVSVVTVLASLFTAVTVVLSWIFLKERLHRSQWAGIGMIFSSIILVSI